MAQKGERMLNDLDIERVACAIEIIQVGVIESNIYFDDSKKAELKRLVAKDLKDDIRAGRLKRMRKDLQALLVNASAEMTGKYLFDVNDKLKPDVGISLESSWASTQKRFEEILREGRISTKSDCEFLEYVLVCFEGVPEYEEAESLTKRIISEYHTSN